MPGTHIELRVHSALGQLARPETRSAGLAALRADEREATPILSGLLEAHDEALAGLAADALGLLADPSSTGALGRAALYGRPVVAARAAAALGKLPITRAAVITLQECLEAPGYAVRREAALALATLAASGAPVLPKRAESALTEMNVPDVTAFCTTALVRLPLPACTILFDIAFSLDVLAAMDAVFQAACHDGAAAKAHAILARGSVAERVAAHLDLANVATVAPILVTVCRALLTTAKDQAEERRELLRHPLDRLAELLSEAGDAQARGAVVAALQEIGPEGLALLAERLAAASPEEAGPLAVALSEAGWQAQPDDVGVRFWIDLGRWEDCLAAGESAIGPLVEVLLQNDPDRRDHAATILYRLGWHPEEELAVPFLVALRAWPELQEAGARAVPRLAEVLRLERTVAGRRGSGAYRQEVRSRIVRVLVQIGGEEARDLLEEELFEDPAGAVRVAALRALQSLEAISNGFLLQVLEHEVRIANDPYGAAPRGGPHPAAAVRTAVLEALGSDPPQEGVAEILRVALADPDTSCRAAARTLFRELWRRWPVQVLAAVASRSQPAEDRDVGAALQEAGLPGPEQLAQALSSEDATTARLASASLLALAKGGLDVTPSLRGALLTGTHAGRTAAARLLETIGSVPSGGRDLAAYWVAQGCVERCLTLGRDALPVLSEALPVYGWRVAGQVASVLLRLGLDPHSDSLDDVARRLQNAASREDERVTQVVRSGDALGGEREVTLTVSHEDERQEAQRLLQTLTQLRAQRMRGAAG